MLLLIAVGYHSCITAGIAGCVACIVKDVSCDILLIATDCALVPVAILIVLLLIVVSYRSCITTSIAGCITGVIESMHCHILFGFACRASKPVTGFIIFNHIIMNMRFNCIPEAVRIFIVITTRYFSKYIIYHRSVDFREHPAFGPLFYRFNIILYAVSIMNCSISHSCRRKCSAKINSTVDFHNFGGHRNCSCSLDYC